jgi:hypothetical protein
MNCYFFSMKGTIFDLKGIINNYEPNIPNEPYTTLQNNFAI